MGVLRPKKEENKYTQGVIRIQFRWSCCGGTQRSCWEIEYIPFLETYYEYIDISTFTGISYEIVRYSYEEFLSMLENRIWVSRSSAKLIASLLEEGEDVQLYVEDWATCECDEEDIPPEDEREEEVIFSWEYLREEKMTKFELKETTLDGKYAFSVRMTKEEEVEYTFCNGQWYIDGEPAERRVVIDSISYLKRFVNTTEAAEDIVEYVETKVKEKEKNSNSTNNFTK